MKDYILPLLLIALIILAPDGVTKAREIIFNERENEGKIAFIVTDYSPVKEEEEEKSEDCECGGTGQIRTGDGRVFPCPCGPNCKCKKKAGQTQTQILLDEIPYNDYYYVKFTAPWCGPCKNWDKNERQKLKDKGISVVDIDFDTNKDLAESFKVTSLPTFILHKRSPNRSYPEYTVIGASSGEELIKNVEKLHKSLSNDNVFSSSSNPTRYTREELDSMVRSNYSKNTPLMKAVMGAGSNVYFHLYNDHGFTKEQVEGLEYWVALALHDATHEPSSITPWRN